MVLVVAADMRPFLSIIAVAATGATFFFVIDLPASVNYNANPIAGILWPSVTMIRALLGNFDITDYTKWTSVVMFCMLNLLIVRAHTHDPISHLTS